MVQVAGMRSGPRGEPVTAGAHSAHRSRVPRRRRAAQRQAHRADLVKRAEDASFLATFSGFAAQVAEQRYDGVRADAYRVQAAESRREAAKLRAAAERCRPWWQRPRAAARDWLDRVTAWSWDPTDFGPLDTRPGVEP